MPRQRNKPKPIVYQVTSLVLASIILQTVLIIVMLILGGILERAEDNAFLYFHDKVKSRTLALEKEMKNWINFAPYQTTISKKLTRLSPENTDQVLLDLSSDLMTMLRSTQVTGAFVVLLPAGEVVSAAPTQYPALYLRDYDPQSNSYANDDIYMISGPSTIGQAYKIPLDTIWQPRLSLPSATMRFVEKPYGVGKSLTKAAYMGYWSPPFRLKDNDVDILTYSLPLHDAQGQLRGVIGVELTLGHLLKFLPAFELQAQDSLGYLIAYQSDQDATPEPIIMGGALQRRMISAQKPLSLTPQDEDLNIFVIQDHLGSETLYAAKERLGLYAQNTPFETESWHLIGIMREDYLLSFAKRIEQILTSTLLVALLVGIFGGLTISYRISRPITSLSRQVQANQTDRSLVLPPSGLKELDVLSESIMHANEEMMASASRLTRVIDMFDLAIAAFEIDHARQEVNISGQLIDLFGLKKEEARVVSTMAYAQFNALVASQLKPDNQVETNVYKVSTQPPRWVRYKTTDSGQTTLGILVDVTAEILEKNQIIKERDHDPLTQLLNRKGFQWTFDKWYPHIRTDKTSAIIMLDLDNLKTINDTYGHHAGDIYIKEAVNLFHSLEEGLPSDQCILGRRSGDEFVIALLDLEDQATILTALDALFHRLAVTPIFLPDRVEKRVSVSGGLMWIDKRQQMTYDELLHYADEALYYAKQHHKGHYHIKA